MMKISGDMATSSEDRDHPLAPVPLNHLFDIYTYGDPTAAAFVHKRWKTKLRDVPDDEATLALTFHESYVSVDGGAFSLYHRCFFGRQPSS